MEKLLLPPKTPGKPIEAEARQEEELDLQNVELTERKGVQYVLKN